MKKFYDVNGNQINVVKVAKPLRYNVSIFNKGAEAVSKKVGRVNNSINKLFVNSFDARITDERAVEIIQTAINHVASFFELFQTATSNLIDSVGRDSDVMVKRTFRAFGIDLKNVPMVKNFTGNQAMESAKIISKISETHAKKVGELFLDTLKNGNGLKDFQEKIKEVDGLSLKNAHEEALNVSRRSFNVMARDSISRHGVNTAIWNHNGGTTNPRPEHEALDGKVFDINNPPSCCGLPGERRHCHCTMTPIITI